LIPRTILPLPSTGRKATGASRDHAAEQRKRRDPSPPDPLGTLAFKIGVTATTLGRPGPTRRRKAVTPTPHVRATIDDCNHDCNHSGPLPSIAMQPLRCEPGSRRSIRGALCRRLPSGLEVRVGRSCDGRSCAVRSGHRDGRSLPAHHRCDPARHRGVRRRSAVAIGRGPRTGSGGPATGRLSGELQPELQPHRRRRRPDLVALSDIAAGHRAEAEGFEPPDPFGTLAFKASAFGRSATLPRCTLPAGPAVGAADTGPKWARAGPR
jgi:hypothetical protein